MAQGSNNNDAFLGSAMQFMQAGQNMAQQFMDYLGKASGNATPVQLPPADPQALTAQGLRVTRISSSGGFLGRRNITLLIGLAASQEEAAVSTLSNSCKQRVEYLATRLEGAPYHLPLSTPITIGGATIFTLKVDYWEEL